jgi:hypothetical protein
LYIGLDLAGRTNLENAKENHLASWNTFATGLYVGQKVAGGCGVSAQHR